MQEKTWELQTWWNNDHFWRDRRDHNTAELDAGGFFRPEPGPNLTPTVQTRPEPDERIKSPISARNTVVCTNKPTGYFVLLYAIIAT